MITTEKPKFTKVTVLSDKAKSVYFLQGESIAKLSEVLGGIGQEPKAKARRGRKPKAAQAVTAEAA